MNAPVMLPSLPGIGSDPVNIGSIPFPVKMWEEDDRTGCSYTPMSQEELAEPSTPRRPNLVSDTPDAGRNKWHPLLADSEHAYAWWMLSQDELKTVIEVIKEKTERKVTSRMTASTPKTQVAVKKEKPTPKPKGTTSKSGSSEAIPPPKSKSSGAPPASQVTPENILPREPKGPTPARSQAPAAGIREQSNPRGKAGRTELGIMGMMQRDRAMGLGTPSVAPQKAKGVVPRSPRVETPPRSRSAERSGDVTTRRSPQRTTGDRSDSRGDSSERSNSSDIYYEPELQRGHRTWSNRHTITTTLIL